MINSLRIDNWNQFNKIEMSFHPKATIITGSNGSGKSTLIKMLSREMGWDYEATAVPKQSKKLKARFLSGIPEDKIIELLTKRKNKDNSDEQYKITDDSIPIGEIIFDERKYVLYVPEMTESASYNIYSTIENNEEDYHYMSDEIKGVSIASHRQPYMYTNVEYIPIKPKTKFEAHIDYIESLKKRLFPNYYREENEKPPIYHMKASIMSLAVFGAGSAHVTKDEDSYRLFIGFIYVLRKLLPKSIGFKDIKVKDGEVILITETGQFLLDAVSGGIGSIIDLAWQIYMYDNEDSSFVVLIDEIENHLHPSMQREILPNLIAAFPEAQFIVTTHSPFVVNSVADSWVYALKYNENRLIDSYKLDFYSKSSDALEILRDILGVPVTLPVWVENKLENILETYRGVEITSQSYINLKSDLGDIGLDEHLPNVIGMMQDGEKQ